MDKKKFSFLDLPGNGMNKSRPSESEYLVAAIFIKPWNSEGNLEYSSSTQGNETSAQF